MKSFFYLVVSILFTTTLYSSTIEMTDKEKLWVENHPTVLVSNENDWAPIDFAENGEAKGYSVDLLRLLSTKIPINLKFVNGYSWTELLKMFDNRKITLMHTMAKNKERREKYSYSDGYMSWELSYLVNKENTNIHSSKDFAGKKIAVGKGWLSTKKVKKLYGDSIFIEYDKSKEMLEALVTHKVDIVFDNRFVAHYLMEKMSLTGIKVGGDIKLPYEEGEDSQLYFVAHKKDDSLISLLNKALKNLSPQEKLQLEKKWLLKESKDKIEFTQKEQEYLKKKGMIKVCIDPNWMPFESFDKKKHYVGMSADYFHIFEKLMGIPISTVYTKTWSESIEYAKQRKCDIYSLAMETEKRKKYMDFTSPYLNVPLVIATKPEVSFIADMSALKNKKVGIVKGYAFNEIIRKNYPEIKVVDVKNLSEGLQKVADGELFGMVGTLSSVGYLFQRKFVGELKIAGKLPQTWELGIGVRNDEPILKDIFEKVLQIISKEQQQEILNKYIAIKYETGTDYKLLVKVLVGVFLLFAFIFYHNRKLTRLNKELESLKNKLQEQADHDPMTHLYNRRYFHYISENLFNIAQRENEPIGIIMVDIDFFKHVNDTYGHDIGDMVIKRLAHLMKNETRKSDIIFRFGGEEFVILLPKTDIEGAFNIAEKLRKIVYQESVELPKGESLHFTVSLGISCLDKQDTKIEDIITRSDKALYKAKQSGRNKVVVYEESLS